MSTSQLESIARELVSPGKGILAADESTGTITKRFDTINTESTNDTRRAYRELLFTTPGAEKFISGVIMYHETMHQQAHDGSPLPQLLTQKGIIAGIKVDTGAKDLAGFPGEKITEGLDALRERLAKYHEMGAGFAKWRAVIDIGPGLPTGACVHANMHSLARYAALCQEAGLVPIVEPEVLMDGEHDIELCGEVTEAVLRSLFAQLYEERVALEGTLLKPNMVIPGKTSSRQASASEVAEATLRVFRRAVPVALPGIVFLSGGQNPQEATRNLNAMNLLGDHPWELSFSYGRALQEPVLNAWQGDAINTDQAQQALYHRASCNSATRFGKYSPEME